MPPGGPGGVPGTSPTPHGPQTLLIANTACKSYWYHTGSVHSVTGYPINRLNPITIKTGAHPYPPGICSVVGDGCSENVDS